MLANLALVSFRQGDLTMAAALYRDAIPILEMTLGREHVYLGMTLAEYSQVLRKCDRKSEGRMSERRAKEIFAVSGLPVLHTVDVRSLRK